MALYHSSIRISLILWGGIVILITLVIFVVSSYELAIGPAIRDVSHARIEIENTRLQYRIQRLLHSVEGTLETMLRYVDEGKLDHDDPVHLNQIFQPLLENVPEIGVVLYAHESGREFLLGRTASGDWTTRISHPGVWDYQTYWVTWGKGGLPDKVSVVKQDYDARERPWFQGTMAHTDETEFHWTQPYVFYADGAIYSENEPGITVGKRLHLRGGTYVLALDVRLRDILLTISQVTIGKHGKAALIFEPGHQVANRENGGEKAPTWSVKPIGTLSSPEIVQGFQYWQRLGSPRARMIDYKVDGERWLGYFAPISIGPGQPHWLGIFVPRDDFMPATTHNYLILMASLIVVSVLLALAIAVWLGKKRFAGPLRQLLRESERLARLELQKPIEVPSSWEEVDKVVAAQETMRRELLNAYEHLKETNVFLEQKIRERTMDLERTSIEAQQSSRTLTDIADSLPCAIFRFERATERSEGRFTFISQKVRDILGFSSHDIEANPELRWTFILPEDEGRARKLLESTQDDDMILERVYLPEKGLRWVEARASHRRTEDGGHCWNGYWLDVTEEQRVRQQLANQLLFQETLFDALLNPIFVKDTDNRYVSCNRAYERAFGVRRASLVGKTSLDIQHLPETEKMLRHEEDQLILAGREPIRREADVLFADGSMRRILYLITGFKLSDGSAGGVIGIAVDVTPMKEMQETLQAAKDTAEQATRVKEDFIANMSHEIRTPMNTILGMSNLALQTPLDAKQRDYLAKILQASQHLMDIINDILDFSKVGAGKLKLEHVKFEMRSVLETVKSLIAVKAAAKGLKLVFEVASDVPPHLVGDPLRLRQVLVNYANNAVKFTERGEIVIRVEQLEDAGGEVLLRFAVRDTGIGLSEADKGRLFQSFSQASPSTARQHGGTGLGLAISKQLAELMGGEVGVKSQPGKGSIFWFTAWLARDTQAASVSPLALDADAAVNSMKAIAGARILLVEDNELNQQVARELLEIAGFEIDIAANGAVALDKVKGAAGRPYDLILMDESMPVMDGLEATRQLRSQGCGIPIVALTANVMPGDSERYLKAGMNDHVAKPIEPACLWNALCKWIRPVQRSAGADTVIPQAPPLSVPARAAAPALDSTDLADNIPGLNLNVGLHNVLGKISLYFDLLEKFCKGHAEDPAKIKALLAEEGKMDWSLVIRLAHTLRSVAGNIGATQIQVTAARLEDACKLNGREEARRLADDLAQQFAPLIEHLTRLFGHVPEPGAAVEAWPSPPDQGGSPAQVSAPGRMWVVASHLAWLLAESDAEALDYLQTEQGVLHECLQKRFPDLETAVGAFEFDTALSVLRKACGEQQIKLEHAT